MESAYALANAEIAEIRRKNAEEQRNREREVRRLAPEYAEIEAQLAAGGLALARCVLDGESDISEIRRRVEAVQAKKADILKKLSLPTDYLDEIHSCSKCRDTGFDGNGRRCSCWKNMLSKYIGMNSNLTEVMKGQTFERFDFSLFSKQPNVKGHSVLEIMRSIHDKAMKFADGFSETHENLYMYGSAGTGKTYVSSCIANRVLNRGFSVYYQSAFQMLDMLERLKFGRYGDDEAEQASFAERYLYDVDLLIIDDVGTEFVSGYSSAALFDIINSRLNSGKSTVISSNLSPMNIEEIYGMRMVSRIIGSYKMLAFIGDDLRRM